MDDSKKKKGIIIQIISIRDTECKSFILVLFSKEVEV